MSIPQNLSKGMLNEPTSKSQVCFSQTVHCGYLIPWESSNSVATPVMQSLKSPVAPGEPGLPSRALEQTKNRLMW